MFVLMEFLHRCDEMQIRCQLEWRPRDTNREADALSKKVFDGFRSECLLGVKGEDLPMTVLSSMLEFADFGHHLQSIRVGAPSGPLPKKRRVSFEKSHWG